MPRVSNSQKWAKRYSNCKSSLFKALSNPTIIESATTCNTVPFRIDFSKPPKTYKQMEEKLESQRSIK